MNKLFLMLFIASTIFGASHSAERFLTRATAADVEWARKYERDTSTTYNLKLKNYPNHISASRMKNSVGMDDVAAWETALIGLDEPTLATAPLSPRYFFITAWLCNQHEKAAAEERKNS